ncbi:MAG: thioesterase family protein [Bacillota bacterium]|nr:thioesterase family protein [Bacillota bacterium]
MMNKTTVRVRYQETDQMGVVYNSNYIVWFEVGRTELCRYIGISYREMEQQDAFLPVAEVNCRYRSPAFYDDEVTIETAISKLTPVRIQFSYKLWRQEELLATGETVHGFTNKNGKLIKLNKTHPDIWQVLQQAYKQ